MVRGAVALSLSLGSTDTSTPAGLDRFVRPSEPILRPFESMATEPVQHGLEQNLAVSAFRPLESRLTEPVSQGLAHNTSRAGVSPRRRPPELASEHNYWSDNFATTLAKVDVTPQRTLCDEQDVWANGLSSGTAGSNGCTSLRSAFAELEDQRKQQHVLQQRLQQQQQQQQQQLQQHQTHVWPRTDSSSTPGTRVRAETPTSEQAPTPRGQLGAASWPHTSGYDDTIGTCTTIAVSGQPEFSELVQAVHRLELKFAALRTEVTAEISCQVRSARASERLFQQQQQQQQPDTSRSASEAESTKLKVEALQRGATRAATAQYELEARVEALRMQLLPCDLEAFRRRIEELETRFQGLEPHGRPGRQGRDTSDTTTNWRSSDPPRDLEFSQDELQAATTIQAIARGNSERKRIGGKLSQHKISRMEATVSSLRAALGAAEDRFHHEVSERNDEIQHKLQLQLGEEFATFERRLKDCEGRLLDEVSAASQAMMVAASSAAKVQDRVETLASDLSVDGGAVAALVRRLDACEQQLPEMQDRVESLASEVSGRNLAQLAQSILDVESRMLTEVDVANEVNTHLQELNLPSRAEFESLQKTVSDWENRIAVEVQAGVESFVPDMWNQLGLESWETLDGRVRSFEDRHEAAQVAEQQEKAATKIQAICRGRKERRLVLEGRVGKSLSVVEVDVDGRELSSHKLPTSKKFKLLEKRLDAWEEQWPAELQKQAKGCLDEFAKQVPSKVEIQELVHTLMEHDLNGWEDRLARFEAARIEVEALMKKVDKHQEHIEELSVDGLKKLLEGFVGEMHERLQEAAEARQALIDRIRELEVKVRNSPVDTVPDDELQALLARCTGGQDGSTVLSPGSRAELGHRLREAQHSLVDRVEALSARLDGMYLQHVEAANAHQTLQRRVDSLQPGGITTGASSDGESDGQGKQLHNKSEAEAWQDAVQKDLALLERRIRAELRAESQLWLTDQQWALATLDDKISLTDQCLNRRIDELTVLALGRGRQPQQAQVAEAAALQQGLAIGTPEVRPQPLGDASTLETPSPIIPSMAPTLTVPSPRRQVQFEGQARFSAIPADDKSEGSTF